jgi:hypothetical protein
MDHVFGAIDPAKVTTGLLKEFGVRHNELELFNGTISADNFVDESQWQSLYSSLYSMRIGTTATLTDPETVFSNLAGQQYSPACFPATGDFPVHSGAAF